MADEHTVVFDLEVSRGPTSHYGRIAGTADRNGALARFTDRNAPTRRQFKFEGDGDTWLSFIRRGPTLEVVGVNTASYHGARAYFDGHYVRVAPLTDVAVTEVKARASGGE
ncbi:MAG: hypothetical protein WD534_03025 [Phycisphaeraceae bacterium]